MASDVDGIADYDDGDALERDRRKQMLSPLPGLLRARSIDGGADRLDMLAVSNFIASCPTLQATPNTRMSRTSIVGLRATTGTPKLEERDWPEVTVTGTTLSVSRSSSRSDLCRSPVMASASSSKLAQSMSDAPCAAPATTLVVSTSSG